VGRLQRADLSAGLACGLEKDDAGGGRPALERFGKRPGGSQPANAATQDDDAADICGAG